MMRPQCAHRPQAKGDAPVDWIHLVKEQERGWEGEWGLGEVLSAEPTARARYICIDKGCIGLEGGEERKASGRM